MLRKKLVGVVFGEFGEKLWDGILNPFAKMQNSIHNFIPFPCKLLSLSIFIFIF